MSSQGEFIQVDSDLKACNTWLHRYPWRCWIPSGTWQDCELQGAVPDQHWRKVFEGCLVQLNRLGSWNLNDLDVMMFKQYLSS